MTPHDASTRTAIDRARNFRDMFGASDVGLDYKGIPIFAAPGLHEAAAALLCEVVSTATRVLELGAGGGALSERLSDLGYAVTASDLFAERFAPADRVPFHVLDLNQAFAVALPERFGAVMALELIEHLENPHHFLRQCHALLEPGGWLVLSTPNLMNPVSQAMFLRDGRYQWFQDDDYREQGHIMPLAPVVIRRCAVDAGFIVCRETSVSDPYRLIGRSRHRMQRWFARMLGLWSRVSRDLRGEVYLTLLHKPA